MAAKSQHKAGAGRQIQCAVSMPYQRLGALQSADMLEAMQHSVVEMPPELRDMHGCGNEQRATASVCCPQLQLHACCWVHGAEQSTLPACLPTRRRLLTLQAQLAKMQVRRADGLVGSLPSCALSHCLTAPRCRRVLRSCR